MNYKKVSTLLWMIGMLFSSADGDCNGVSSVFSCITETSPAQCIKEGSTRAFAISSSQPVADSQQYQWYLGSDRIVQTEYFLSSGTWSTSVTQAFSTRVAVSDPVVTTDVTLRLSLIDVTNSDPDLSVRLVSPAAESQAFSLQVSSCGYTGMEIAIIVFCSVSLALFVVNLILLLVLDTIISKIAIAGVGFIGHIVGIAATLTLVLTELEDSSGLSSLGKLGVFFVSLSLFISIISVTLNYKGCVTAYVWVLSYCFDRKKLVNNCIGNKVEPTDPLTDEKVNGDNTATTTENNRNDGSNKDPSD